jgi:hypothetical protein
MAIDGLEKQAGRIHESSLAGELELSNQDQGGRADSRLCSSHRMNPVAW